VPLLREGIGCVSLRVQQLLHILNSFRRSLRRELFN